MYFYHNDSFHQKAGVELKSKRGPVALTEWGKRWESMFTTGTDESRLSRARSYARKGRVLSVSVHDLHIKAEVVGNEYKPYSVTIDLLNPYSTAQWNDFSMLFSEKSLYLAHFLEGAMPPDSETLFDNSNNPLVPLSLESGCFVACNCYDWEPHCKHVLAVLYVLTEMIDESPLLLFQLRGRSVEDIIKHIKLIRENQTVHQVVPSKKLELFWQQEQSSYVPPLPTTLPRVNAYTLLGNVSWKVDNKKIKTLLAPLYAHLKKKVRTLRDSSNKK